MVTVTCVLRSGGEFGPEYVRALENGLEGRMPEPWTMVCLSDMAVDVPGVDVVPLRHGWPGKWSLVEWWRPGIYSGRVLAVGLDTLFVVDLSDLAAYDGPLAGISDLYNERVLASGVMAWDGDEAAHLYEAFLEGPEDIMGRFHRVDPWMRTVIPHAERLQDHFPDQIVSLKAHHHDRGGWIQSHGPPAKARVVCAHGDPRLHDPKAGWAHERWAELAA